MPPAKQDWSSDVCSSDLHGVDAGVDTVVFDRGGNRYHGRVAGIADGAREAGLTL